VLLKRVRERAAVLVGLHVELQSACASVPGLLCFASCESALESLELVVRDEQDAVAMGMADQLNAAQEGRAALSGVGDFE